MSTKNISVKDEKSKFILEGNLYKVIIKLSIPIIIANFIQTVYNLTDTFFVSKLGDIQVAAIGVVWPLVFFLISLGTGLSLGAVALISQYIGANDGDAAKKVAGQIVSFGFIVGIAMSVIGIVFAPIVIKFMGAEGEIYQLAVSYVRIIFLGIPFAYMFFAFQAIQQAQGNMALPTVLSGISVALNIGLDALFIFTFGMGINGAAIATLIARGILGIVCIVLLFTSKKSLYKPELKDLAINFDIIKDISKTGIPASFGQMTTSLGFIVLNSLVLSYGENVLTAFIIGNRIVSLVMMPCMGIGTAISTVVGQNIGAGLVKRTKEALGKAIQLAMIMSVLGVGLLLFMRMPFIRAFTQTQSVMNYATDYSTFIILAMPLMALINIWTGLFIGAGKGTFSMMLMMTRLWVYRLPSVIVLKYIFHINEYAIWYPMVISNVLACLTGYILYKRGNWLNPFVQIQDDKGKAIIKEA